MTINSLEDFGYMLDIDDVHGLNGWCYPHILIIHDRWCCVHVSLSLSYIVSCHVSWPCRWIWMTLILPLDFAPDAQSFIAWWHGQSMPPHIYAHADGRMYTTLSLICTLQMNAVHQLTYTQSHENGLTLFPLRVLPVRSSLFTDTWKSSGIPGRRHLWMGVGLQIVI